MMFGRLVGHRHQVDNFNNLFKNFDTDIFEKSDLAWANLEGPISDFSIEQFLTPNNFNFLFSVETMIPPYYLQIAIGIYLIQMIFILTGALVLIEDGEDRLNKKYQIGKNLKSGIFLFFIVSLISSTALYFLATVVLGGLAG
jgi:hypothetical protein